MRVELIEIQTSTEPLDGLLYLPDGPDIVGSVQIMHGNTMNFYVGPPRFLPPVLTKLGLACLAYNRRGHDVLSNRNSRDLEGGAFQTIAEAVEDNRLARAWIDERGLPSPFVIGHSNGGMLAVRHVVDHVDTPGLVLLSAHRGGPNVMRVMADNGLMAADRFDQITAEARRLVHDGRNEQLMLVPGWWYVISAGTYLEFLERCPDIVELASDIPCDTLYIRDIVEPPDLYPAEAVAEQSRHAVDVMIMDVGGHYYVNGEDRVCEAVRNWLEPRIVT